MLHGQQNRCPIGQVESTCPVTAAFIVQVGLRPQSSRVFYFGDARNFGAAIRLGLAQVR
jgi:hypothetical protein